MQTQCVCNLIANQSFSGCLNDKQQRQKKILSLRALPKAMRTQSYDYGKCTYPKKRQCKKHCRVGFQPTNNAKGVD
ncbi:MAG: hypothetical protein IJM09_01880 [Neisseriaceae bacterium]|nr:hypothetical protein [Neisseriaceae bacterium]